MRFLGDGTGGMLNAQVIKEHIPVLGLIADVNSHKYPFLLVLTVPGESVLSTSAPWTGWAPQLAAT